MATATLNYGIGKPRDDFSGQLSPASGRVAGQTTQQFSVSAEADPSVAGELPDDIPGITDIDASIITWGWDKDGRETGSSETLDLSLDATGDLDVYLANSDDVFDASGGTVDSTGSHLKTETDGDVTFDQSNSRSTVASDASGSRALSWNSSELKLESTSAGIVAVKTEDDGVAYDDPKKSIRLSFEARASALITNQPQSFTSGDVALQVLAASDQPQAAGQVSQGAEANGHDRQVAPSTETVSASTTASAIAGGLVILV